MGEDVGSGVHPRGGGGAAKRRQQQRRRGAERESSSHHQVFHGGNIRGLRGGRGDPDGFSGNLLQDVEAEVAVADQDQVTEEGDPP